MTTLEASRGTSFTLSLVKARVSITSGMSFYRMELSLVPIGRPREMPAVLMRPL